MEWDSAGTPGGGRPEAIDVEFTTTPEHVRALVRARERTPLRQALRWAGVCMAFLCLLSYPMVENPHEMLVLAMVLAALGGLFPYFNERLLSHVYMQGVLELGLPQRLRFSPGVIRSLSWREGRWQASGGITRLYGAAPAGDVLGIFIAPNVLVVVPREACAAPADFRKIASIAEGLVMPSGGGVFHTGTGTPAPLAPPEDADALDLEVEITPGDYQRAMHEIFWRKGPGWLLLGAAALLLAAGATLMRQGCSPYLWGNILAAGAMVLFFLFIALPLNSRSTARKHAGLGGPSHFQFLPGCIRYQGPAGDGEVTQIEGITELPSALLLHLRGSLMLLFPKRVFASEGHYQAVLDRARSLLEKNGSA